MGTNNVRCPSCGTIQNEIYFCRMCNTYWCLSVQCPEARNSVIMEHGRYRQATMDDLRKCKRCKVTGRTVTNL